MKNLVDYNVFPIACGSSFGLENENLFLLYSPLLGTYALATPDEVERLNDNIKEKPVTGWSKNEKDLFPAPNEEDKIYRIAGLADVRKISILPTFKCNFKCVYCYSAEGRDFTVVNPDNVKRALDFFINPERTKERELTVSYLGGGEPFLSWDIFKYSLDYSDGLARRYGFQLMNSVNTNGSILTDEMLNYLVKYDVTVCVTFEIFEEIQNKQRGQWAKVKANLERMLDAGARVIISSIITPDSVDKMPQMINEVVTYYPRVRTVVFEPVVDVASNSFDDQHTIEDFYHKYIAGFFEALPIAEQHRVRLLNSVIRKLWVVHTRFCDGEISLTPEGKISGCTSVSSPKERLFEKYNYGDASQQGGVYIDEEKFESLLHTNVHTYEKCKDCFLKWHCCGGCQFRNELYSEEQLNIVCNFSRCFATRYLLWKMSISYFNEYGEELDTFVNAIR